MPPVTRSKKYTVDDTDPLSGLMSRMNITPKSTRKQKTPRVKKEKDIADLFSGLGLTSKSRRIRGEIPNTVANRKLVAFGNSRSAFSTVTLSRAYSDNGFNGEFSSQ